MGCATNPATGDREFILMSTDKERSIDAEAARQVEAQLGLVEDPELSAYVDAIGQRIARHSPRHDVRYHFHVVEMVEPNAFALPGGHIYVSRGLLLLSNSEAELAGVLGHEIGHVAARHAAQRDALQKTLAVMTVLGAVGMAVGGPTSSGVYGPFGMPGYYAFSRDQESQADELGMEYAVAAGFDPHGIADFLDGLDRHARLQRGYSRGTSYFDSHPATRERAALAATHAEVMNVDARFGLRPSPAEYLQLLDGLHVETHASEGVIDGRRFLHADLDVTVLFPPGWQVHNTRAAVIAVSPGRNAMVSFELEADGDDPLAAARGWSERTGSSLDNVRVVQLDGVEAVRAETKVVGPGSRARASITWVAAGGLVYRLSGLAFGPGAPDPVALGGQLARSFRRLDAAERDSISAPELAVVKAFEGESLAELSRRTGNEWTLEETAIYNGLDPATVLARGDPVKVVLDVPYDGRAGAGGRAEGVADPPGREVDPALP